MIYSNLVKHCLLSFYNSNILFEFDFIKIMCILYLIVEEEFSGLTLCLSHQWLTKIVFLCLIFTLKAFIIPGFLDGIMHIIFQLSYL